MASKLIIGVMGNKGVGKDLFATAVESLFPKDNIKRMAFADPIREDIIHQFQLTGDAEYDIFKRGVVTFQGSAGANKIHGRDVVRNHGMSSRNKNENHFVDIISNRIAAINAGVIIVTDVRFENEFDCIKSHGGCVVHINRLGYAADGHVSEALPNQQPDYVLVNKGESRQSFFNQVEVLYKEIRNKYGYDPHMQS